MKKSELISFLNKTYSFSNQEEWDNCGVTPINYVDDEVTGVFVSLDMNNDAFVKALENNCNVIVSHHPILLSSEQSIVNDSNLALLNKLTNHNIINIALHTCFDAHQNGSSYLVYKLIKQYLPIDWIEKNNTNDYLLFANLKQPITVEKLVNYLKQDETNFMCIRVLNKQTKNLVRKICIGAGSCSSMMNEAIKAGADCFLTGDVKWHSYLDGLSNNLAFIDIGHTIERVFIPEIKQIISLAYPKTKIIADYDLIIINNY